VRKSGGLSVSVLYVLEIVCPIHNLGGALQEFLIRVCVVDMYHQHAARRSPEHCVCFEWKLFDTMPAFFPAICSVPLYYIVVWVLNC
jgi:hypothetical protein